VQSFGTGKLPDPRIAELVNRHFDFRLAGILKEFNLRHLPAMGGSGEFYQRLAAFCHFGRTDMELPWERTDKADILSGG
jgi:S-adenosylmethionine synthetase